MMYPIVRNKLCGGTLFPIDNVSVEGESPYDALYNLIVMKEVDYPESSMSLPQYDSFRHCWFWEDWMVPIVVTEDRVIGVTRFSYSEKGLFEFDFDNLDYDGFNGGVDTHVEITAGKLYELICKHAPECIQWRADDYGRYCKEQ